MLVPYHVTDRGRVRKFWSRVGTGCGHKEGDQITLFLDATLDGRIILLS
jgi:hypothetical protein